MSTPEITLTSILDALSASGLSTMHDAARQQHIAKTWDAGLVVWWNTSSPTNWAWETRTYDDTGNQTGGDSGELNTLEELDALLAGMKALTGMKAETPAETPAKAPASTQSDATDFTVTDIRDAVISCGLAVEVHDTHDEGKRRYCIKSDNSALLIWCRWSSILERSSWLWEQRECGANGEQMPPETGAISSLGDLHALLGHMGGEVPRVGTRGAEHPGLPPGLPTPSGGYMRLPEPEPEPEPELGESQALLAILVRQRLRSDNIYMMLRELTALAQCDDAWALELLEENNLSLLPTIE